MKDLKHIRRFNESEENLNISDVIDSYDKQTFEREYKSTANENLNELIDDLKWIKETHGKEEMIKVKKYFIETISNYH